LLVIEKAARARSLTGQQTTATNRHQPPPVKFSPAGEEDRAGTLLVEPFNLENNFCWSNDYPHHEGTWPHSAAAIERDFAHLREDTRAKILGLNAARFFNFKIPEALV